MSVFVYLHYTEMHLSDTTVSATRLIKSETLFSVIVLVINAILIFGLFILALEKGWYGLDH